MSKFNIMETTVAKVQAAYLDGTDLPRAVRGLHRAHQGV